MRKAGVALIVIAYVLLLYIAIAAPAFARAHPHLAVTEYAGPWPVALTIAISLVGLMLAWIPIRRGERWAIWTSLAAVSILLVTRAVTDPRCAVVLDPSQHGCHTFMISMVVALIGLALAGFGRAA